MSGRVQIYHNKRITSTSNPLPVTVTNTPYVNASISEGSVRIGGTYDVGGNIIDESSSIRNINRAHVNINSGGVNEVVKSNGERIRVLALIVWPKNSDCYETIRFLSDTTPISADFMIAARVENFGMILPFTAHGWFETDVNHALNVEAMTGAGQFGINIVWAIAS